ncbi:Uncharacterized RNA methyltransferase BCE_0542 [[Clostridium] ultunense Esp]|nr:Uncharacterized RNA methyltransferase BCE_0542 [[Clostridium] ultunense Esp]
MHKEGFPLARGKESLTQFKEGEILTVPVKRIGINGEGIGYDRRQVLFIPGALPNELVKVMVTKVERRFAHAELLQVIKPSPERRTPPCPISAECGGCQLQHLSYPAQLKAKEDQVREAFVRYTSLKHPPIRPIIGMEEPWGYRNKGQLQVGMAKGKVIAGLYAAGSHRLVDLSDCPIQHPKVNEAIRKAKEVITEWRLPIYDERKNKGLIRTLVARVSFATGETQLTLVATEPRLPHEEEVVEELRRRIPHLASISLNVNPGKTSLVFGPTTLLLWGKEKMKERLGEVEYRLSPRAFFQLNPVQTVKLYRVVAEAASLTGSERVIDAYSGVGSIALWLAPDAKEIRGIEEVPEAVADARENAKEAGFAHVHFTAGRAEEIMPRWVKEGFRPDVVVVDPPRTGMGQGMMDAIVRVRPARLVYVSCNPSTLAKNAAYLMEKGYEVKWIQPVDMFPQTAHVECVVSLKRKHNP